MLSLIRRECLRNARSLVAPSRPVITQVANSSGHHNEIPEPGSSFPFDINNKYKITLYFILFVSSGLSIPFLAVRHQLKKA